MTAAAGGPDDGGLFGSRREGPTPKLVVVGILWAGFGVVALITALLMKSVGIAVFGVLCVLAGGGLYAGQRARERLEEDERSWRSDPGGFVGAPDPGPADDDEPGDRGDDDRHATRVMSTSSPEHDDIVDAEFVEWEPSPSDQDDGTGYDDDEMAFRRRRENEWARDDARAREDDTQVIEADDGDDADHTDERGPDDRGPDDGPDGRSPRTERDAQR